MAMSKAERSELRSLIRTRFKILRADVKARESELTAELIDKVARAFAEADKVWADVQYLMDEHVREANRRCNDELRNVPGFTFPEGGEYTIVGRKMVSQPRGDRDQLRNRGVARIQAQVSAALAELERQEADLLTRLIIGSLESEEAKGFLGEIPTVSALVPAERLLQLERQLDQPAQQ